MANHHQSNGTSPAIDVDGAMQATMEGDTQRNDGEVNQEVRKDQTTKEPPIYPWDVGITKLIEYYDHNLNLLPGRASMEMHGSSSIPSDE